MSSFRASGELVPGSMRSNPTAISRIAVVLIPAVLARRPLSHLPGGMILSPLAILLWTKHIPGLAKGFDTNHPKSAVFLIGLLDGIFNGKQ